MAPVIPLLFSKAQLLIVKLPPPLASIAPDEPEDPVTLPAPFLKIIFSIKRLPY